MTAHGRQWWWRIDLKGPDPRKSRWKALYSHMGMDEALHKWSVICSRAKSGQSTRRGAVRLIKPDGSVEDELDLEALHRVIRGDGVGNGFGRANAIGHGGL